MAKIDKVTPVEFIETTTEKLSDVQGDHPGAFIHVNDDNGDDTLYIGDDLVTDKFNIKSGVDDPYVDNPSDPTIQVGNFKPENYGQLQGMTVSQILRAMFRPISVESISLNASSHTMKMGDNPIAIEVSFTPSDVTNKNVTWGSSDSSIVSVDENGFVTAISVGGPVTITALASGKPATWTITVEETLATSVSINPSSTVTLNEPGKTQQLTATVSPATTTNKTVTWSSNKPEFATVDENGLVTAVGVGTATITVMTSNGKTSTKQIKVVPKNPPTIGNQYPYASISYDTGIIEVGTNLPTENDLNVEINGGTWTNTDNVQYTGGNTGILLDIKKDGVSGEYLGQPAEVGTYTITGKTTFLPAETNPTDNFGQIYTGYQGGEVNAPETITIVAVYPISVSMGSDISEMVQLDLFNYLEGSTYFEVNVPEESAEDKFRIGTEETFVFYTNEMKDSNVDESLYSSVYQWNDYSKAYDILTEMDYDETNHMYVRHLERPTERKGVSLYKIKFKK